MVFIIPCLMFLEVRLVGRLFLPEIILLGLFPFLLMNRGQVLWREKSRVLIVLGLLWLFSQIVTDMIRSIPFADFARGWANITFFLIELLALYLLVFNSKKRLILFAVGIVIGQFLQYLITPNIYAAGGAFWKFGIGFPITFLLVLSTQLRSVGRITFLPDIIILAAAVLNFVMGARSLGGICFITALYLFIKKRTKTNQLMTTRVSNKKLLLFGLILMASGIIVLKSYGLLADSGVLGEAAQKRYESQTGGEFGLLLGGRQELLASSLAIMDSPIIGHGSWAKDPKYIALLPELLLKFGYDELQPIQYNEELSDPIPTHSFLFGAWVNSGLLGAVFWLWIMLFCAKLLLVLYKTKDPLSPVVAFVVFNMFWNILFSPFGAETRVYTAYYLVLLMFVHDRLICQTSRYWIRGGVHYTD